MFVIEEVLADVAGFLQSVAEDALDDVAGFLLPISVVAPKFDPGIPCLRFRIAIDSLMWSYVT